MGKTRIALFLAVCLAASEAGGQEIKVQVQKQRAPCYVGYPVLLRFTIDGFDESPAPTLEAAQMPEGLRAQTVVNPPIVSRGYAIFNGRASEYSTTKHVIDYRVTANRPGDFHLGPFTVKQGTKEASIKAVPLTIEPIPEDPDSRVQLVLPKGNIYPDQRVPVEIEWWYAGNDEIRDLRVYSPLFDMFRFGPDRTPGREGNVLTIETQGGAIQLAFDARKEEHEGRQYVVCTARRTLIPDRVGEFAIEPVEASIVKYSESSPQARVEEDDFGFGNSLLQEMLGGARRNRETTMWRVVGNGLKLVVKPFPSEGRPESFAGAVGDGFSINVAADRTVVRAGDPIGLTVTLRGQGNLENASLPPLSAEGGLNPDLFRIPEGDVPGAMKDGVKEFRVSVRVSSESVTEIPALTYSWFDPATETYQTARSKPIALRVMPAQVVSAADVVSSSIPPAATVSPEEAEEELRPRQAATAIAAKPVFSLSGADLAIEPLARVVLRDSRGWMGGLPWQMALYGAGALAIIVALVDRRRRDVDPAIVARSKNVQSQQKKIALAARRPQKEAAAGIAEAMRALVAELPDVARADAQSVIARCESIVFAPAESASVLLDAALIDQARSVAERFREATDRIRSGGAPRPNPK